MRRLIIAMCLLIPCLALAAGIADVKLGNTDASLYYIPWKVTNPAVAGDATSSGKIAISGNTVYYVGETTGSETRSWTYGAFTADNGTSLWESSYDNSTCGTVTIGGIEADDTGMYINVLCPHIWTRYKYSPSGSLIWWDWIDNASGAGYTVGGTALDGNYFYAIGNRASLDYPYVTAYYKDNGTILYTKIANSLSSPNNGTTMTVDNSSYYVIGSFAVTDNQTVVKANKSTGVITSNFYMRHITLPSAIRYSYDNNALYIAGGRYIGGVWQGNYIEKWDNGSTFSAGALMSGTNGCVANSMDADTTGLYCARSGGIGKYDLDSLDEIWFDNNTFTGFSYNPQNVRTDNTSTFSSYNNFPSGNLWGAGKYDPSSGAFRYMPRATLR